MNFHQNLYGEVPEPMRNFPPHRFPKLESLDLDFLGRAVTGEGIKTALFHMAPLKAPGSDGFHALFFQKHWGTVGPIVCEWVKKVFNGSPIDAELNNILIVLIPKVHNSREFS